MKVGTNIGIVVFLRLFDFRWDPRLNQYTMLQSKRAEGSQPDTQQTTAA